MAIAVIAVSIVLQMSAAVLALRLIPLTGRRRAWMLIAGALCLMAARRCVTLYGIVTNGPDSPAELVAHLVTLAISLFALGGVACIGPLFRSMQRAEAVARESLTRFQEMTDLLPDMLCELDADLNVTYANRAAFATLGYVQEELDAGIKMSDLVRTADMARARTALVETTPGDESFTTVYDLQRKDGSSVTCEAHSAPIFGPEAAVVGYRVVVRDITERTKLAEAERLAAIGQLAGGVAHEFNNIFAGMSGRAQLAEAIRTREVYDKLVDAVLECSARGSEISDGLMGLARPLTPTREAIPIEQPIDAALSMAARDIEKAKARVERKYDSRDRRVSGHAGQLQPVFLHLIINACQAMQGGGDLVLETRYVPDPDGPGEIVVRVSDNGPGIPPEDLPRIFEPFFTTRTAASEREASGIGLGLSVSRGIMRAHGGTIGVQTELGAGTTFEVRLPAYAGAAAEETDVAGTRSESRPIAASSHSLLVVEPEDDLREMIAESLIVRDFRTATAATANEAIAALKSMRFHVVICDPGALGGCKEIIEAVGRLPHQPLVIGINDEAEEQAEGPAFDRRLRKPFEMAELLEVLREVLDAEGPPE